MSWGDWGADDFALKAFRNSIGWNARGNLGRKLVSVDDPVNYVICGDAGPEQGRMTPGNTAYPDVCMLNCAICDAVFYDDWWTWDDCGEWLEPGCTPVFAYPEMVADSSLRKPFVRHLGGVNLGFLDGHAAWWNSERLLAKISEGKGHDMMGLSYAQWSGPASWCVVEGTGEQWPTLY
jgi:prepilin-type processing-associated H-X9-DG protein